MARKGGISSKYYRETRGIKVSGGQHIKSGTVLTRNGHRWKPGLNVIGLNHLTAACEGEVYFTKKRGNYRNRAQTYVNVKPVVRKVKTAKK